MSCSEPFLDETRCPLCGQANDCQLSSTAGWKGPCWCAKMEVPRELIAQIPVELRNRACICRDCIAAWHRQRAEV